MAVKHAATHTADNQLTAAEYDEAHTVEAGTIGDAEIAAHTSTKIANVVGGSAGTVTAAQHGAIATGDLHTEYQKESEKSAASGYASLGADSKVPDAESQVASTHPAATTAVHGVGASTVESASGSQTKVDTHAALTATHGATGAVVGTTNTQTLSAKTLTTPKIDSVIEETLNAGVIVDGVKHLDSYEEFDEVTAPATPAANKVRVYAKDKAGVSELFYKNDAGTERDLSAGGSLTKHRHDEDSDATGGYLGFILGQKVVKPVFMGILGNGLTEAYTGSAASNAYRNAIRLQTGTVSGNYISERTASDANMGLYDFAKRIVMICYFRANQTTLQKIRFGIWTDGATAIVTANHMGFEVENDVLYATNGDGTTQKRTDTGVVFAANTLYRCVAIHEPASSQLRFYVDDMVTVKVTHTLNRPTGGSRVAIVYIETNNAAARIMDIHEMWVIQD